MSKVNSEIQAILNEKGMFNSEIENIDKEFMENLRNAKSSDIIVSAEYIWYSEHNDDVITTVMSRDKINKVIAKYAESERELSESDLRDIKASDTNSVIMLTSAANSRMSSETKNSVMKKTIVATKVKRNNKNKLSCSYVCTWLSAPSKRYVDLVTIGWGSGQGSFDYNENYSANYTSTRYAKISKRNYSNNTIATTNEKESYSKKLTSGMRNNATENGLSCKTNLYDDYEEINSTGSIYSRYTFKNHKITMNFYLTNIKDYVYFVGQYFHQKKKGGFKINSVSASFNVLSGEASLKISGDYKVSTYYKKIGANALLNYEL